jgi:hypothetical protein
LVARDGAPFNDDDDNAYSYYPNEMIANYVGRARDAVTRLLALEEVDPLDDDDYVAALVDETLGGARRVVEARHYAEKMTGTPYSERHGHP